VWLNTLCCWGPEQRWAFSSGRGSCLGAEPLHVSQISGLLCPRPAPGCCVTLWQQQSLQMLAGFPAGTARVQPAGHVVRVHLSVFLGDLHFKSLDFLGPFWLPSHPGCAFALGALPPSALGEGSLRDISAGICFLH